MTTTLAWLRVVLLAGLATLMWAYLNSHSAQAEEAGVAVSYQEGYSQGCSNGVHNAWLGRVSAGFPPTDDKPARYASDPDFRSGWDAGYKHCYDNTKFPQGVPTGGQAQ